MRAHAPPIWHRHLDRPGRFAQPEHDRAGAVPRHRRAGPRARGGVHPCGVRGLFPRWRGDRARRAPADPAAAATPAPPHRGHRGVGGRRGDDRRGCASCGATATGCPTAIRPTSIPTAARAGCWGPRSPRSSCPRPSPTSPRSPRSSGRPGARPRPRSAVRLQLVLCAAAHRDPLAALTFGGDQADRWLNAGRAFLQRHWPSVLAGLALVAGVFVALIGITGIAASSLHFLRRLHRTLHG